MSGTRQDDENEDVQQDESRRPPSPSPRENDHANNNEERQEEEQDNEEDVPPDPNKSYHEFDQESQEIIPSNKFLMTFKPGELLALKLVWLTFVNITHSFLALNL